MGIMGKSPGDVTYGKGKVKSLKKMPDGNPFPYEREYDVHNGIQDDEKVSGFESEPNYTPKVEKQIGDTGKG